MSARVRQLVSEEIFYRVKISYLVPRELATLLVLGFSTQSGWAQNADATEPWQLLGSSDGSDATARHETASVVANGKIFLIGGRGMRPVDRYDPATETWASLAQTPFEMHHFQPVFLNGKIYLVGGFGCCYPNEPSLSDIHIYDPVADSWSIGDSIPAARRRGGQASVVRNGKIYVLGGNTLGHNGGAVPWFDEYDPATGNWTTLADAPNARDHFGAVLIGDKLVAAGGRQSDIPDVFDKTVAAVDVYDFSTGSWITTSAPIPTERAGAMVVGYGSEAIVVGGEVSGNSLALDEVEAFDVTTGQWRSLQPLQQGRHSGGAVIVNDQLHVVTGGATRGGGAEITAHEALDLNPSTAPVDSDNDGLTDAAETTIHMTDPQQADTDNDSLSDGDEVLVHLTDPNNSDSDSDTLTDDAEVLGVTNPNLADTDSDGLDDNVELAVTFTEADNDDTDNDSLSDGDEVNLYSTDPLLMDTDSDGLDDAEEIVLGTDPTLPDTDFDSLSDLDEHSVYGTNPKLADSDADGLSDASEINQHQSDPLLEDSDSDGVVDGIEISLGFDPTSTDTDGDGIDDATEIAALDNPPVVEPPVVEPPVTPPTDTADGSSGGGGALFISLALLALIRRVRSSSASDREAGSS